MAKLTARFDMQDRISKKIRTIRGEIDKLERARSKVNKPVTMTMRAKDMASKILKKLHIFVLKDIAKTHTVTVQVKDKATKALTAVSNFMKRRMPRTHALFVSVKDRATPVLQRISRFTQRSLAKTQLMTILAVDRAMPIIRKVGSFARSTLSKGYNFTVRGIDMASRIIGRVSSYAATAIPRVRTFTIRAINAASNVIGNVKRALFSIPTVITVTLAAVGIGKLGEATAGAAMNFEGYGVSMKHWLDGNQKKADELVSWMGKFADSTPFSSPDLFPALATGVGIAGGDVKEAQRMLMIATDMAALTPGRTVSDAMDALGSAQMGNFVNLKAFGMRVLDEDYKAMGGWTGFLDEVGTKFEGGALKLSETSSGIIETLKGYRGSFLRSIGEGILEPMKPRLDGINKWLENNQEAWGRWKDTAKGMAEEASEWAFSKLENGFSHIKSNYLENDDFKKLDFEGKIAFIAEDIGAWWSSKGKPALNGWWESSGKPWAEKIGLFVGESIFNGILTGIKEGGKALGGMWSDAFKDPSLGAFGGAGVATVLAGMLASLVLNPLITAVSLLGKGVKGAGKLGKKVSGWFGKDSKPKTSRTPKRGKDPAYRMPWTSRGEKPVLNTPNAKGKGFKMPKGLSKGLTGLGKFAKRVPVIGTALGALSILTAKKEDKAGAVGAVGGGLGGAALGAAIGSVVPGLGTAIGGIIGGIAGSIGGGALGDWLSENWSSIKKGASNTTDWIVKRFNKSVDWVKDTWSSVTGWFSKKIWKPLSDGFNDALDIIVGIYDVAEQAIKLVWGKFSSWFDETIWTPLKTAAGFAWDFITTKVSDAWTGIQLIWGLAWTWFDETVWTPISIAAGAAWDLISGYITSAWNAVVALWGVAWTWFEETVWNLIKTGVEAVGTVIGEWFQEGWNLVTGVWDVAATHFEENIWSPIKNAVIAVKDAIVGAFEEAWETVSGIFAKIESTRDAIQGATVSTTAKVAGNIGKTVNNLKNRGADRRGNAPGYARGTKFHPGGPAILGDGGGTELIRYPNGSMSLSPSTDTMMNLPRGTEVLSHKKTIDFFNSTPAYADGVGFGGGTPEKVILPQEQVAAASSSSGGSKRSISKAARDIIVQITGDNHYHDEMDAEKVGEIAWSTFKKKLEEEDFEGGEMVVDV